jgi:hypothetical protein
MLMQTYENSPKIIYTVEEFNYSYPTAENRIGTLEIWGTRDAAGAKTERFLLIVDSSKLRRFLNYLHERGKYEPATMSPASFLNPAANTYYSHRRRCRFMEDWMETEFEHELQLMYDQWKAQHEEPFHEIHGERL